MVGGVDHRRVLLAGDVADDGDDAGRTRRELREVEGVLTAEPSRSVAAMTCVDAHRSPLASLTATIFGCSASVTSVSV